MAGCVLQQFLASYGSFGADEKTASYSLLWPVPVKIKPFVPLSLRRDSAGFSFEWPDASVAANTLAWWLVEGGFDVTVVEKASKFREGGQSIDVRGQVAPCSMAWV